MSDTEWELVAFARALARLSDPFADRGATLALMGMREAAWRELEERWRSEIERRARLGDRALADRFVLTFAAERELVCAARAQPSVPLVTNTPAETVRRNVSDIDTTGAAIATFEPALPFRGALATPPPSAVDPAEREAVTSIDATLVPGD